MKKNVLKIAFLLALSFNSCDKAELTQNEITQANKTSSQETMRQSSMFNYIESINVNNGLNTECENNILIFPSWEKYHETIENLDEMTENYCNAFDANIPDDISDEEYDALCESAGFDEDNILRQFEEDLAFCSLRQKIETEETAWLEEQGDGEWNADEDPDNDFIDEESERALLSHGHEVIIGSREKGYKIYKFTEDGGYIVIEGINEDALVALNQGATPASVGATVIVPAVDNGKCKEKVKEINYEEIGDNKIKRKSKLRPEVPGINRSKIAAITKGYKKKRRGGWKVKRTWIAVGITAENNFNEFAKINLNCIRESDAHDFKNERRRKVKAKIAEPYSSSLQIKLQDNKAYSFHNQGQITIYRDFYDMPEN